MKQLKKLTKASRKFKTKILHKGKKKYTKDIEDELVEWILTNQSLCIHATSWEVIIKNYSLDESIKKCQ